MKELKFIRLYNFDSCYYVPSRINFFIFPKSVKMVVYLKTNIDKQISAEGFQKILIGTSWGKFRNISGNLNRTAWISFYIELCIVLLCTQLRALILFKTDHNFRVNQKYLIGALCCPQIILLIQFVMRRVHYFINQNVTLKVVHFGGRAGGLFISLDRLAEIKFNLKCLL